MPFIPQVIQYACRLAQIDSDALFLGADPPQTSVRIEASADLIEKARLLQQHRLIVTYLLEEEGRSRVLRIDRADEPFTLSPEAATEYVFERWSWTLAELGK